MRTERDWVREEVSSSVFTFASMCDIAPGINSDAIVLKGHVAPNASDDVELCDFVALSDLNKINTLGMKKFSVVSENLDKIENLYGEILKLYIPEKESKYFEGVDTDSDIYEASKSYLTLEGMPYVMVGLGKVISTGERVAKLFFAQGVSPKDALSEIKKAVLAHRSKPSSSRSQDINSTIPHSVKTTSGDLWPNGDVNEYLAEKIEELHGSIEERLVPKIDNDRLS